MYRTIEDWMIKDLWLRWNELVVYCVIYSSQEQTYTRGQDTLARTLWLGARTVNRILKNLVDDGILEKVPKWHKIVPNWQEKVPKWRIQRKKICQSGVKNTPSWHVDTIYITNKQEEKKTNKKKETKKEEKQLPSVCEIVDAFVEDYWVNDERIVAALNKRLAHKQKTKAPYKTIQWALKQIQETLGWIWTKDRSIKFERCVNDTLEKWRQGLGRYDNSESRFYHWLEEEKRKAQRKAQKESQNKPPSSWWGFWKKDIENILDEMLQL